MEHVAHAARLGVVVDGFAVRTHLERRALRVLEQEGEYSPKTQAAFDALEGPEVPLCMQYLVRWSGEVYGRSGVGMNGLTPLTYATICEWAMLYDHRIEPHEVRALLLLDSVRLYPPKETDSG